MQNILICGGGNLGHVVAAWLSLQDGCAVSVLTRNPERWASALQLTLPDTSARRAPLRSVTAQPAEVVPEADIVLLCLPGFALKPAMQQIAPYLSQGAKVGSVVSSTGFFLFADEVLPAHTPLFGFQRVPFIARTTTYGHSAALLGFKSSLAVATENIDAVEDFCKQLSAWFGVEVALLKSRWEAALTNSNPLLHPARLYSLWSAWDGEPADNVPGFYTDWTDEASTLLLAMDTEFQQLTQALHVRPGAIPPLTQYYESPDAAALTRKISSIPAFQGIPAPMQQTPRGYIPDFAHRYFTEDFPYGLRFAVQQAQRLSLPIPTMQRVYDWGMKKINDTSA